MPVTFEPNALIVEKLVAKGALTQLNLLSVFARAGLGDYEPGTFELGNTVKIRRPRISEAVEYDPRTGSGLTYQQPGYVTGELTLEKLFANGFPIYSTDYRIDQYVLDFSTQIAFSLTSKFDGYLYDKFRAPIHPGTGIVEYGCHPPIAIVAAEKDGEFQDFNRYCLVQANTALEQESVPPGNRYAILSSTAKGAYIGEAVPVDAGYLEALSGGVDLLQRGLPTGQFIPRHGFLVGGSNLVGSQVGGPLAGVAISGVVIDTTEFIKADYSSAVPVPLGAMKFTVADATGIAVGEIARIGVANATAKAYGVVLRVVGNVVTLVPFTPKGRQVTETTYFTTGTDLLSIPDIPSVSVAFHQEALAYASREMRPPSAGSGAVAVTQVDQISRIALQVWRGSYDVAKFRENQSATLLCGAKLTDYRKSVLMLSL